MAIEIYPSVAKVKRNGVFQNLPGFVQRSGDNDIEAMIARKEISPTATFAHPKGSYFILNDILYKATDDIPVNGTISVGDNCEVAILADDIYDNTNNISDLKNAITQLDDATFYSTYNLVDCNDASKWVAQTGKDVTITIPEPDTVRVQSNVSQAYASALYYIDTANINSLYISVVDYYGTGTARMRLYGVNGTTLTNLGTINKSGSTFDVSNYNSVAIELNETTSVASAGYMDYYKILAADSDSALPYIRYAQKEPRIDQVEKEVQETLNAISAIGNKFYASHRGAEITAPENTMPSFIQARQLGFKWVETDIRYTSDGVAVLLHDGLINRTARNADGTAISGDVNIADITYEQALTYDFGIWKGEEYAGTKIPTLAEFLKWCKATGTNPVMEQKIRNNTELDATINALINANIKNNFAIISATTGSLERIFNRLPDGKYLYIVTTEITSTEINAAKNSLAKPILLGNYTLLTTEIVNSCKNNEVKLYAFLYNDFSAINSTNDYVSGYIVRQNAI